MRKAGQIILNIFLAVLLSVVLGLLVVTVFPYPSDPPDDFDYDRVLLDRMLLGLALTLATLILGVFLPRAVESLRFGVLLAALLNLVTANFWGFNQDNNLIRLAATSASLIVTAVAAWWYLRDRKTVTQAAAGEAANRPHAPTSAAAAAYLATQPDLAIRVAQLEQRLDAVAQALAPQTPPQPRLPEPIPSFQQTPNSR